VRRFFVEKIFQVRLDFEQTFEIFGFCANISQNSRPILSENKPKSSTTDAFQQNNNSLNLKKI